MDYRHRLGNEYEGIRLTGWVQQKHEVDKKVVNCMKKRGMLWSRIEACSNGIAANASQQRSTIHIGWDRHPENDVLNPVSRLRQQVITSGHEALRVNG